MKDFQAHLEERRAMPLYNLSNGTELSKYQHVEQITHDEVAGLLGGTVVVQHKIDGANATVAWDKDNGHLICTRNNTISIGGNPETGFRGLVEYVLAHEGLLELSKQYILRGEWLIKHSINYAKESFGHFYIFDVQRYDGTYLSFDEYLPLIEKHNIKYVPVIATLHNPTINNLAPYLEQPDGLGSVKPEGIVIKRYDFINRYGRYQWAKIVNTEFKLRSKSEFRSTKKDDIAIRFAAKYITEDSVLKIIHKMKDEGEITIRNMKEILGRSWYDVFTDHLWDFVKENKVKEFDFKEAQRQVTALTSQISQEYFNGLITDDR